MLEYGISAARSRPGARYILVRLNHQLIMDSFALDVAILAACSKTARCP